MSRSVKRIALLLMLVLGWMWIYRLPDGSALAEVKDDTGLFSSAAIQKADELTRQIRQKYGKEVLVEVFPEIPQELRGSYSPDRKEQFFAEWMKRRAQELKVDGIYVLICRNPSYVQVDASAKTRERAFTQQNIEQLRNILLTRFKNKEHDQGLLEGVQYAQRTLETNLANAGAAASSANPQHHSNAPSNQPPARRSTGWIWWALLIVLAIFIISAVMRARRRPTYGQGHGGHYPPGQYPPGTYPPGQYPPGAYPPQGGGGFGRGVMGGLLGGMAGGWLYDKMSNQGHSSGYAPPPDAAGGPAPLGDDQGQGFTGGAGGDFGGDAGGGDFGGGGDIGGGGDFGGGDGGAGGEF